jgi:thiosulfate dehydrogenase
MLRATALAACLVVAGGCARPAEEVGREAFSDPRLSTAASNAFSCETCHETVAPPVARRPGYPMADVAGRAAYWGGTVITLLEAVNQCLTSFMRSMPLSADDERGRALLVYLRALSPSPSSPALPLTIVRDIVDVPSGDAARGARLWDLACRNCHGAPATGEGRISDRSSILPDDTLAMFGTDPVTGTRPITIEKVRHGKFYGIGGDMAPYALELLSDAELGDLLAYLETFGLPESP